MSWSDLSMSQRSELMSIYLKNGITSLDEMKKHYNSFAEGGSISDPPYTQFLNTLPDNLKNSGDEYNMRRYWELNGYPKDFNEGIQKGMFTKQDDGYHANSVAFNPVTNSYEFMKNRNHPTYNMELDWYYSDDPEAVEFRKNYRYTPGIGMIPDQYTPRRFDTRGPVDPERFFGVATPEVTDNTVYQPTYGTLLPEVKVNSERPSWQHNLTDYDLARLRSGQISSETAKSIAQKRATGISGFMEDLNRLSNPMHEGLSGYRKFMNEHPSLELAYDAASAGLSAFPVTAPIGYTMAGIDLLSGIDDMAYNGPAFDNIIDVLGVMPAAKYSKTIKGVKGAKKGLRYRRGIPDITINPIGTPIFLGELWSDLTDAINIGEENSNENPYANGGKIHIKPENRGKFTDLKERTGHSASWFKENGTPAQKKMAVFALNARKWKK